MRFGNADPFLMPEQFHWSRGSRSQTLSQARRRWRKTVQASLGCQSRGWEAAGGKWACSLHCRQRAPPLTTSCFISPTTSHVPLPTPLRDFRLPGTLWIKNWIQNTLRQQSSACLTYVKKYEYFSHLNVFVEYSLNNQVSGRMKNTANDGASTILKKSTPRPSTCKPHPQMPALQWWAAECSGWGWRGSGAGTGFEGLEAYT